jgi:hypothetical protein
MKLKAITFIAAVVLFAFVATGDAFGDGISQGRKDGAKADMDGISESLTLGHAQQGFSDHAITADDVDHSVKIDPVPEHILTWSSAALRFRRQTSNSQDPVAAPEVSSFLLVAIGLISLALFRRRNIGV